MGPASPLWRGGNTKERVQQMSRAAYRDWRRAVYVKDDWTCQHCGAHGKGTALNAHHILPWAEHRELRYVVGNGQTLCRDCHLAAHRKKAS